MSQKRVLYTENSRNIDSFDVAWSAISNTSLMFPGDTTAADFLVPDGMVMKVTAVMWTDSPTLFVPDDNSFLLRMFIDRSARQNLRRTTGTGSPFSITQFSAGFLQGVWIPVFVRVDQGSALSLNAVVSGIAPVSLRYKIQATLAKNTGAPLNEEFTNSVRLGA